MAAELIAHPLFPLPEDAPEDAEPADVYFIVVTRREIDGLFTAPRIFKADELTSEGELFGLYGGGSYELLGRGPNNARIVARRSLKLPGASKPMFDAPEVESAPKPQAAPPALDPTRIMALLQAAQPSNGGTFQMVIALIGALAPVFVQYLSTKEAQTVSQQQQHQQFMATLLGQSNSNSDKLVQVMGQLYSQKPAGAVAVGPGGTFSDGVQWVQDFLAGQAEGQAEGGADGGIGAILKDLAPFLEMAMKQGAPVGFTKPTVEAQQ